MQKIDDLLLTDNDIIDQIFHHVQRHYNTQVVWWTLRLSKIQENKKILVVRLSMETMVCIYKFALFK